MEKKVIEPSVLKAIGKNVRQIRLLKGLSQESFASDIDKSTNFVSLLENGKTGLTVQTIIDICKSLGVDSNAIFTGLIPATEKSKDDFIIDSLNLFDENDKTIVTDLISYIINSKN